MAQRHILIICGEASGDLNAANLIIALKQKDPNIRISGAGGRKMKESGAEMIYLPVESGDENILRLMKKPFPGKHLSKAIEVIRHCADAGTRLL